MHRSAIRGVIVAQDIEAVLQARGTTLPMEEAIMQDTVEATLVRIIMGGTTIAEDIMGAIPGITTEAGPRMVQHSGSSSGESLSGASTIPSGGLITPCRCLRLIMTLTTNTPILRLRTWLRSHHLRLQHNTSKIRQQ